MNESEERKFLHEVASPLTSLQLNLEIVATLLGPGKPEDLTTARALTESCRRQVKKISEFLLQRREALLRETEK